MAELYAEGGNYRIELDDGIASCRVWRRPDVDAETGAAFAREKIAHFRALAVGRGRGMVFDLREAPPVTGPKTQEAVGQMFSAFESHHKPIAVVVGGKAVQKLQMKRLVGDTAPKHGAVFQDLDEAMAHVRASLRR
ncbi:MAG TPA: hypothetical protein RMH99_23130 [Sandaracinaceae bacterium LLY-WYZ-13_1]|nr:hypothetical protein [Sandaracinaceae bacterium LLY-WYZ-13_1]